MVFLVQLTAQYTEFTVAARDIYLSILPQIREMQWVAPSLHFGADGFAKIAARTNSSFTIPLRPIVEAAGFYVNLDDVGRIVTLTRSALPLKDSGGIMSLSELIELTNLNLSWNSAEHRLEARE